MKIRTILIAVAVLVVVVIGGLFIAVSSVDINSYKGLIAEEAEKATGRKLVIAGDADLSISLTPSISVSGVSFANASWGSRPEMAKLENVSVEVALMPLISGDIQVNRLVLSGLDLLVETDSEGRGNWLFDAPEKPASKSDGDADAGDDGGAATLPTVKLVVLKDILVAYRDGKTGESRQVKISQLEARADNAASPLDFTLEAALNNQPIKASGRLGALASLADTREPWPLDVKLSAGGAEIELKGTINNPLAAEGMSLDLSVGGQSLSTFSQLAGAALPKLGPYSVAGKLVGNPQDLKIEGLALKMGGSDIGGGLRLRLGGKVPRIDANFKSGKLDAADFSTGEKPKAAAKATPAAKAAKKKRLFPSDPLPLDGLAAVNADITVAVSKLLASGMVLEDVALKAKLEGGKATLSLKKARLSGGGLSGALSLDGRKGKSSFSAKVKIAKLDLGRLLKEMKITDLLTAKLDAGAEFKGRGNSVRQIMAGLNGKLTATSVKGRIGSKYVDLLAADLLTSFVPGGPDKKDTEFNCLVVGFNVKKGIASNTALLFDTDRMVITGGGKINLRDETLDMQIKPKPKKASLISLAVPIDVGGTLAEPTFLPNAKAVALGVAGIAATVINPAALLIPLMSSGADDKNPCVAGLKGGGKKSAAKPATSATQPPPAKKKEEGGIGGVFKSLGKTLLGD